MRRKIPSRRPWCFLKFMFESLERKKDSLSFKCLLHHSLKKQWKWQQLCFCWFSFVCTSMSTVCVSLAFLFYCVVSESLHFVNVKQCNNEFNETIWKSLSVEKHLTMWTCTSILMMPCTFWKALINFCTWWCASKGRGDTVWLMESLHCGFIPSNLHISLVPFTFWDRSCKVSKFRKCWVRGKTNSPPTRTQGPVQAVHSVQYKKMWNDENSLQSYIDKCLVFPVIRSHKKRRRSIFLYLMKIPKAAGNMTDATNERAAR